MSLSVLLDLSPLNHPSTSWGVRRYAQQLALSLRESADQHDLSLLSLVDLPFWRRPQVTKDIPESLEQLEWARRRGFFTTLGRRRQKALEKAANHCGAQLIHSLTPEGSPRIALSHPRVVTCRHLDSRASAPDWHGTPGRVRIDRRHFHRAERVIAMSRATAQELITRLDVPHSKISVVYGGIDSRLWNPERKPDDASRRAALGAHEQTYFLCVGHLDTRRNSDGILRAFSRTRELTGRRDIALVWAGEPSATDRQALIHRARQAGVDPAVRLLGGVSDADLAALYRGAIGLVFVPKRKGFGFPLVEAMACGCPVVTSTCPSLPEVAGEAALAVDPEDIGAMADAMILLSEHPQQSSQLRRSGLRRAAEFSLEQMAGKTAAVYHQAYRSRARDFG